MTDRIDRGIAVPYARVNVSDRPFALPPRELASIVVDLPFPVSVNKLYAFNNGNRNSVRLSAEHIRWKKEADAMAMQQKVCRNKCIEGPFRAELLYQAGRRADCDNLIKVCLDAAQRWNLIANDKYCREINIKFVASHLAPQGARLTLVELVS